KGPSSESAPSWRPLPRMRTSRSGRSPIAMRTVSADRTVVAARSVTSRTERIRESEDHRSGTLAPEFRARRILSPGRGHEPVAGAGERRLALPRQAWAVTFLQEPGVRVWQAAAMKSATNLVLHVLASTVIVVAGGGASAQQAKPAPGYVIAEV